MIKNTPMTPSEVKIARKETIPPEVFKAINTLLAENYKNGIAKISQEQVINLILALKDTTRNIIFDNNWLDIEEIYKEFGWNVTYYKADFFDTEDVSFFEFKTQEQK